MPANCTDGDLRIVRSGVDSSVNESRGRLEICANNVWFSIRYTYNWGRSDSLATPLACRSLGYSEIGKKKEVVLSIWITLMYIVLGWFHTCSQHTTSYTEINSLLSFWIDATSYEVYFLDMPQLPLYPFDLSRCSASSETLLSCRSLTSLSYNGNEVGISCTSKTIGTELIFDGWWR